MTKNDRLTLEITDLGADGSGVGRAGGMAVFVPFTAPGDRIDCRIVRVHPTYAFGVIEAISEPSPLRREPDCPAFGRCGGCSLRHLHYGAECSAKETWVRENMRRIGKTDADILPILQAPAENRYRNKAIYPLSVQNGAVTAAFYAKRSHRAVPHADCLLHPRLFTDLRDAVTGFLSRGGVSVYDEQAHRGLARALFIRVGEATGEVMLGLVLGGRTLPKAGRFVDELTAAFPQIKTVIINENTRKTNVILGPKSHVLAGDGFIRDDMCGLRFRLALPSFYQVNRAAAERLYAVAAEYAALTGEETLLDLYCGVGTIGLSMAAKAKRLIGVEVEPAAVADAAENARLNGVAHARFIAGDAAEAAQALKESGVHPDVMLLDPPRKGLSPALIGTVAGMGPARVVMVSCDSATAARDVALFAAQGYRTRRVQPVDMFPRSAHVECVCLLTRGG